jgi:hypothetical protein
MKENLSGDGLFNSHPAGSIGAVLRETIRLMSEIDDTIEDHRRLFQE